MSSTTETQNAAADVNKRAATQRLYDKAKTLIPGGTQLFGKRQEMFAPQQWPPYFAEARGCTVVDMDGNEYIDMCTTGIGATVLGYADPDVTAAVIARIEKGTMCNLSPPEEVALAELMMKLHPWAQMARFGRTGGESMTVAVRIVRARTGRDKIAFCGYHGWHDWYLAANLPVDGAADDRLGQGHLLSGLEAAGVPRGLAGTALPFTYNKIDELKEIVDRHGRDLAGVVMEPTRSHDPDPGFLESVRELTDRCGARLVFDEISIGWKLCVGGAHLTYGVDPDVAVFSKSTGNGHPISAIIGNADTMQAAQDTFISSALWTEAVGPTAAVAAIKKMMRVDLPSHIDRIGRLVRDGLGELAERHHVPLGLMGHPPMMSFRLDHPKAAAIQTLWTVRMLDLGFLVSGGFFAMLSHESEHVDRFLEACDTVFSELGKAIEEDDVESRIGGPVKHTGFQRLA